MTWYERHGRGWRARWRDAKGQSIPGPVKPTEEAAKAWAIATGHARVGSADLETIIKRWREVRRAERNVTDNYLDEAHDLLIALCAKRSWTQVHDITLPTIADWRVATGGRGVRRPLAYLLAVLRWAAQNMQVPVAVDVLRYRFPRRPAGDRDRGKLNARQIKRIVDAAGGASVGAQALVHYLATYGARPVSACRIKVSDIDIQGRTMRAHGKRSGRWRHPIAPETTRLFRLAIGDRPKREALFLDPRSGEAWKVNRKGAAAMCGWYRRLVDDLVPESVGGIYDLKRYAITRMLTSGLDPSTVALFTGHLALSQVLVYARVDPDAAVRALSKFTIP